MPTDQDNPDPASPPRRKPRNLSDLTALLSSDQASPPPSDAPAQPSNPPHPSTENSSVATPHLTTPGTPPSLPDGLEPYLSPDLVRKLRANPEREVYRLVLEQLHSQLFLISTYLPYHLVQEKIENPIPGIVKGKMISGSLLFSDVSGFTALSEKLETLGPKGAERMTALMNQYFTLMLEILSWSGGILLKFAGDALLVYFPAQVNDQHCKWVVRAGMRMLRAMPAFSDIPTPSGLVNLKMKIGVASGTFLAASVGDASRMEYVILGEPVKRIMEAEASSEAGQLVCDDSTAQSLGAEVLLQEKKKGYSLVQLTETQLDDFELPTGRRRARGAIPWSANEEDLVAQIQATFHKIESVRPYLPTELIQKIISHARRKRFDSEYRPTTVMFCNLTGLETILNLPGEETPQRVTGFLNAFFTSAQDIISRFGGVISRVDPYKNGSKMLVLFGAPVTHEDDPQRAVNAALALQLELNALNDRWSQRFFRFLPHSLRDSPLLQLRIGVTQGITFAGLVGSSSRREYTVMGDQVNLAARLMGSAETGQVLISQGIQQEIAPYFVSTPLPAIKVKGKSRPIPVYQVEAPRLDILNNRIRSRGEFIGRQDELARGIRIMQKAMREASAQILWITGLPGVGKSFLADRIIDCAMQDFNPRSIMVQSQPHLSETPYAAWKEILLKICDITPIDSQVIRETKQAQLLESAGTTKYEQSQLSSLTEIAIPETDAQTEEVVNLAREDILKASHKWTRRNSGSGLWEHLGSGRKTAADKGAAKNPYLSGMMKLLQSQCRNQPLILLMEDAHYLDTASIDMLLEINQEISSSRLLIIVLHREDQHPALQETNIIHLKPFGAIDTASLVSSILISQLVPIIQEQTGGNPLLIEQISQWLKQQRKLTSMDLIAALRKSDIIQKLILSNLEVLPERTREVSRAASIVGNEFRSGEVAAILANMDAATLSGCIRDLVKNQMINLTESGIDPQYKFNQSLIREVLYNSIPYERRIAYHNNLAEYLTHSNQRRNIQSRLSAYLGSGNENTTRRLNASIARHYYFGENWILAAQYYLRAAIELAIVGDTLNAMDYCLSGIGAINSITSDESRETTTELKMRFLFLSGSINTKRNQVLSAISDLEQCLAVSKDTSSDIFFRATQNLAVLLICQNRLLECEAVLSKANEELLNTIPELLATRCWLAIRKKDPESERLIEKAMNASRVRENLLIQAILYSLGGETNSALEMFRALQKPLGIAIACVQKFYQKIQSEELILDEQELHDIQVNFEQSEMNQDGLALILYLRAQIAWRYNDLEKSRERLIDCSKLLSSISTRNQKIGRDLVRSALRISQKRQKKPFALWPLYEFEDRLYQSILFFDNSTS